MSSRFRNAATAQVGGAGSWIESWDGESSLCDPDDVIIARTGITDFRLNSFYLRIFNVAELEQE